ncbi:MAG TPA: hypothetical protein VHD55_01595 [Candidatus Paceibacterota bacterium]|nr:hypothetical protein [Candidatus Paceibacterota bacterium]
MRLAGLNVEVLTVERDRKRLQFRWLEQIDKGGSLVFTAISLDAFGVDRESPQVPIVVFRGPARRPESALEYHECLFAQYAGGHQDGPLLYMGGGAKAGTLVASDFQRGDRLFVMGCRQKLTGEIVKAFCR